MARPSGTNSLTFFMNEEDEEEEMDMEVFAADLTVDNLSTEMSSLDTSQASQTSVEEENSMQRERVLTDKYLAGQLSFKDFVSEINAEEDDEEELMSDDDEEWKPPGKKAKAGKSSRA